MKPGQDLWCVSGGVKGGRGFPHPWLAAQRRRAHMLSCRRSSPGRAGQPAAGFVLPKRIRRVGRPGGLGEQLSADDGCRKHPLRAGAATKPPWPAGPVRIISRGRPDENRGSMNLPHSGNLKSLGLEKPDRRPGRLVPPDSPGESRNRLGSSAEIRVRAAGLLPGGPFWPIILSHVMISEARSGRPG